MQFLPGLHIIFLFLCGVLPNMKDNHTQGVPACPVLKQATTCSGVIYKSDEVRGKSEEFDMQWPLELKKERLVKQKNRTTHTAAVQPERSSFVRTAYGPAAGYLEFLCKQG